MRAAAALLGLALLATGCGSGGGNGLAGPKIGKAKSFAIAGFEPSGPVKPGVPTTLKFHIQQPSGGALTRFKTGSGPHTGVHLILVRDDLSQIIHRHPPIAPDGTISQVVTFPAAGPYHVLVDVYPALGAGTLPNFQLTGEVHVTGAYKPKALRAFTPDVTVAGNRFAMNITHKIKALQASFLDVSVKDPSGQPAKFTAWYGALAHAIFFKQGSLAYFHTHVCGTAANGCASNLAGSRITGKSTTPGQLSVGLLLPTPGTWKLFLQTRIGGRVVTAPYTLKVG